MSPRMHETLTETTCDWWCRGRAEASRHLVLRRLVGLSLWWWLQMRGVYPLKYYASQAYGPQGLTPRARTPLTRAALSTVHCSLLPRMHRVYVGGGGYRYGPPGGAPSEWDALLSAADDKFVLVGGKGGVGKTTTSASLAVECAERGFNTLVVSTDPAHSLGDALDVDLSSGEVVRVEGLAGASLYAIEVKVDEAVAEFKRLVSGISEGGDAGGIGGQLGLADFADIFDAVPPGVDELIALSKIVALARADSYGLHFSRVVVDTAPTGASRLPTMRRFVRC